MADNVDSPYWLDCAKVLRHALRDLPLTPTDSSKLENVSALLEIPPSIVADHDRARQFEVIRLILTGFCFIYFQDDELGTALSNVSIRHSYAIEHYEFEMERDGGYRAVVESLLSKQPLKLSNGYQTYKSFFPEDARLQGSRKEVLSSPIPSRSYVGVIAEKDYYAFWRRWHRSFVVGSPLDWELQRQVALISDDIWRNGPKAVAREIEKIETRFALEQRIAELETEKSALITNRFGLGGNAPPEPIQDPEVSEEIAKIWSAIESLKVQTEAVAPNKDAVRSIIDLLSESLIEVLKFCGRMGEHATKVAITVAVTAGGAKIINPELLDAVIKAAKAWLAAL